jgi:hypothetical protein
MKPSSRANGVTGSARPMATTASVEITNGQLGRLRSGLPACG